MKKTNKIIIIVVVSIIVVALVVVALLGGIPNLNKGTNLKDQEYTKNVENASEEEIINDMLVTDENGIVKNYSDQLSSEKFFSDFKVGIYNIKIVNNDNNQSILTYTIKNHSNNVIESFKYRIQFVNYDGTIAGTVDLDTQKLGSLDTYNVKLNLDRNIMDIYDIVLTTDFENYGKIGGVLIEA